MNPFGRGPSSLNPFAPSSSSNPFGGGGGVGGGAKSTNPFASGLGGASGPSNVSTVVHKGDNAACSAMQTGSCGCSTSSVLP